MCEKYNLELPAISEMWEIRHENGSTAVDPKYLERSSRCVGSASYRLHQYL